MGVRGKKEKVISLNDKIVVKLPIDTELWKIDKRPKNNSPQIEMLHAWPQRSRTSSNRKGSRTGPHI